MNSQANFHPTLLKLETTRDEHLRAASRVPRIKRAKAATAPETTRGVYGRRLRFAIRA